MPDAGKSLVLKLHYLHANLRRWRVEHVGNINQKKKEIMDCSALLDGIKEDRPLSNLEQEERRIK